MSRIRRLVVADGFVCHCRSLHCGPADHAAKRESASPVGAWLVLASAGEWGARTCLAFSPAIGMTNAAPARVQPFPTFAGRAHARHAAYPQAGSDGA